MSWENVSHLGRHSSRHHNLLSECCILQRVSKYNVRMSQRHQLQTVMFQNNVAICRHLQLMSPSPRVQKYSQLMHVCDVEQGWDSIRRIRLWCIYYHETPLYICGTFRLERPFDSSPSHTYVALPCPLQSILAYRAIPILRFDSWEGSWDPVRLSHDQNFSIPLQSSPLPFRNAKLFPCSSVAGGLFSRP